MLSLRFMKLPVFFSSALLALSAMAQAAPVSIFDGKSFDGWEGDLTKMWRIADGCIVGGSLTEKVARNEFLATQKSYGDFELTVKFKLTGTDGFINSGFQIRSQRVPNNSEMAGYQADYGEPAWYGCISHPGRNSSACSA